MHYIIITLCIENSNNKIRPSVIFVALNIKFLSQMALRKSQHYNWKIHV